MAISGSSEQELNFEIGNVYLIKVYYNSIQEVYVEKITETAYKLRKQSADGSWYVDWILKSEFNRKYTILEFLEKPKSPPPLEVEKSKISISGEDITKECPICDGSGQVPDHTITSGKTTCPKCLGSGRVWK
uniref:hypothetical protein n=1 Tax=Candidatus Electrothrix sp. TaxID=2170559 RepID=UPI004055AA2A